MFVDYSMQIFLRYIHYEFGKMFVTPITLSHAFKKNNTNVHMMSKCFRAEFPRALNPGAASSCSAV